MQINFKNGSFITPEQAAEIQQRQLEQIKQMLDEKRCELCKRTYLIHTANDQYTYCEIKKECVDGYYGKYCSDWCPLHIDGVN